MASGSSTRTNGTELVGTAGLRPLDDVGLEIFYSLVPGSWGKGYATEAARAVVDNALGPLGLPEVLAEVDEGNVASVAVIKRLGMTAVRGGARQARPDDPLPQDGQLRVTATACPVADRYSYRLSCP